MNRLAASEIGSVAVRNVVLAAVATVLLTVLWGVTTGSDSVATATIASSEHQIIWPDHLAGQDRAAEAAQSLVADVTAGFESAGTTLTLTVNQRADLTSVDLVATADDLDDARAAADVLAQQTLDALFDSRVSEVQGRLDDLSGIVEGAAEGTSGAELDAAIRRQVKQDRQFRVTQAELDTLPAQYVLLEPGTGTTPNAPWGRALGVGIACLGVGAGHVALSGRRDLEQDTQ